MSKKGSRRFGSFFFFVPVVVVIAIVVLGIISLSSAQTGTLIVAAISSDRYAPSVGLHATVTVGSTTAVSPFNFTLSQGSYAVVYGPLTWFLTPHAKSVVVAGGKTQYAIAVYDPIIKHVGVGSNGFNVTTLTALHAATPVVWINTGSSPINLEVVGVKTLTLGPLQNLTLVFQSTGSFTFDIPNSHYSGTVRSL